MKHFRFPAKLTFALLVSGTWSVAAAQPKDCEQRASPKAEDMTVGMWRNK